MKLAISPVDVVFALVLPGHLDDIGVEASGTPAFLTIHYIRPLWELLYRYSSQQKWKNIEFDTHITLL